MSWLQRYRVRRFLMTSFWVGPVGVLLATVIAVPGIRWLDYKLGWQLLNFTPDGARAILSGLSSSMLTFLVFVLSALLLAVQLASAQMTPRIIAMAFSDRLEQPGPGHSPSGGAAERRAGHRIRRRFRSPVGLWQV
ncbi:MAG TPA: DUF2254 family protein [Thermoleophilia bacterium]|nr:DUF2254 family protein [Thermoleophilia bacterium]